MSLPLHTFWTICVTLDSAYKHHILCVMPNSWKQSLRSLLLLVNDKIPGVPPCQAHDLISCKVTAAIGYRGEVPEHIEDSCHPRPNHCQVAFSQTWCLEVLREEVVTVLHHGRQKTHLQRLMEYAEMSKHFLTRYYVVSQCTSHNIRSLYCRTLNTLPQTALHNLNTVPQTVLSYLEYTNTLAQTALSYLNTLPQTAMSYCEYIVQTALSYLEHNGPYCIVLLAKYTAQTALC